MEGERKLEAILNEPIKAILCGKEVELPKPNIKKQLAMFKLFEGTNLKEVDEGIENNFSLMIKTVSIVSNIPENELNENGNMEEVLSIFTQIYARDVVPLLKRVADMSTLMKNVTK